MNTNTFRKLLSTILMLSTVLLWAQDKAGINGTIVLSDNTPAENITVSIKGTSFSTATNTQGQYEFKNVKPGSYTIRVSAVGTDTAEQNVTVAAGEKATVDFTLSQSQEQLNELIINGGTNRYTKSSSVTSSRIALTNLENAQVYNVVTKELMADQLITNQDDALKNVPGVYQLWGSTGRAGDGGSYFASRGFVTQALVRNGIAGTVIANNDAANLETIEAIKGPSATLFGSVLTSYGGLVNRVTKKPYEKFGGEASFMTGSYGYNRATVDVNTPLDDDKKVLFRLNAATTRSEGWQDTGSSKSFFFAPAFTFKLSDRLTATLEGEFFNQDASGMHLIYLDYTKTPSQIGLNNAADLNYDFKRSMLGSDFITETKSRNFFGTLTYKISDEWTSQSVITSSNNQAEGPGAWLYLLSPTEMSRNAWGFAGSSNAIEFQQNFSGDFNIGGFRNRIVAGGDIFHTKGYTMITYLPGFQYLYDTIDFTQPSATYYDFNQSNIQTQINTSNAFYRSATDYSVHSAYINDVFNLTPNLLLSAGVRFDNYENRGAYDPASNTTAGAFSQNALSPKFGVVYQLFNEQLSLFANYQNSFRNVVNPNAGMNNPDLNTAKLDPEQANQFEAGIKLNAFNNKLGANISYYNIYVQDIVRTVYSGTLSDYIQDGNQRSEGFEAEITAAPIDGLNIRLGYAYNDAELNGLRPTTAGPQNLANFWVSYKLPAVTIDGLGIGFGGNYGSETLIYNQFVGDIRETFALPSYTVLNASIFYDKPKYRVSLKVNNLTDELYFNGYTTINVQAPRTFMGALTYKF